MLLSTAMQMIVESGFDGLTMPGLAERADVAVGGLYRYFASKQELLAALQVHSISQLGVWIDERRTSSGLEGVRETALAVESFGREHSTSFALLELAISDPRRILDDEQAAQVQDAVMPILLGVAQRIGQAEANGEITPGNPMRRTMALWGTVFGCLHFRKRDSRIPDPELHSGPVLRDAVEALLRGWRP
ncbi:MAG: TetR/AcrR family transcriptional regulator [Alphaproteobacteria bacterium]|nr:TetR/AcrR family transcriptional regulator [Alphaproteobacteria bacterium]